MPIALILDPLRIDRKRTGMVQIVVLDQGKVVESGTHAELLSKESKYADMWRRQATVDDSAHLLSAKHG